MRAGPARERERSSRRDARDLGSSGLRCSVSETRCNCGAFRDRSSPASGSGHPSQMGGVRRRAKQCFATRLPHPWPLLVWPSLAKQLPPGTTIAPLTLQRDRHGSKSPPGPFYEARVVGACLASERPALPAGRIPERLLALKLEKSLASCGATFAGSFAPFRGHGPLAQGNFLQAWLPQGLFPQTELRRKVRAVSLTRGGGRFASARCRAALPGISPLMEGPHHPMDAVTGR